MIQNFIPTIWSENLRKDIDANHIAVEHCNRSYEGEITEMGCRVRIGGLEALGIYNYRKDLDIGEPEELNDNLKDLEINQAKFFNFMLDDIDRVQGTPKLLDLALHNASVALANEAEHYVFSLVRDFTYQTVSVNLPTLEELLDAILDARTKLLEKNVSSPEDIVIEVSPKVAKLLYKAKLTFVSDNTETFEKGYIGSIGGCKVYVSNQICQENNVHYCAVRTKRAIAFAEQLSEIEAYRPQNRFADAIRGLYLFGAKVIYADELVNLKITLPAPVEDEE